MNWQKDILPPVKKILIYSFIAAACFFSTKGISEFIFYLGDMPYGWCCFLALVIVLLGLLTIICIRQNQKYKVENKIILAQKKEIETLNENQSRFFSCMSHEIRTPINTIIGLDEMILREEISDEVAEDAQGIAGAGNMLLALINDILDMSKIESKNMEIVMDSYDTGSMLSDVVNMILVRAREKNLDFKVDITSDLPTELEGDEVRIKQILINLLNNAVKYTKEGSVAFSVRCEKTSDESVDVIYTVEDTGLGIRKESIPYLFDAFKRVDIQKNRMIEGTGLGLSIVKQLSELMGGSISVHSIYLKGSTFTFKLPQRIINKKAIGDLYLRKNTIHARPAYHKTFEAPDAKILIVDDNEMNLIVETKLLRDTKIQIDTAGNGKEALKLTQSVHYNVILLDHLMPEMDGITCLHEIRRQTGGLNGDTPIIALTANAGKKNQDLYEREGFDSYLSKPVVGIQLEAALLKLLPEDIVSLPENANIDVRDSNTGRKLSSRKIPIVISTDSVCDLPKKMLESLDIPVLPGSVVTKEGAFLNGEEIDTDAALSYMAETGNVALAQESSVEEYEEFFARELQNAQYLIHFTMSSRSAIAYENAVQAAKSFDNITVVDSGLVSSGMGLMVLYARQCTSETSAPQIVLKKIEESRKLFSTSFLVQSLKYLEQSGRISHIIKVFCDALMIHPVLIYRKGALVIGPLTIGDQSKAKERYIKYALRNRNSIDDSILFITYAGMPYEELQAIKEKVLAIVPFKQTYFQKASPAVACNCGTGSFGLLFKRK